MANAATYTPPGTIVSEVVTQSINPLIGSAANVCIVGLAGTPTTSLASLTTTDVVLLSGTTPVVLPTIAALNNNAQLLAVSAVTDVQNPAYGTPLGAGYVVNTDYQVNVGEGPPGGVNATIARLGGGSMPNNSLVAVTYTYLPTNYYQPMRFYNIASVEAVYGNSYATALAATSGQTYYTGIGSQLSFAARMAFANGAASVICQPLFTAGGTLPTQSGYNPQTPAANAVANTATWSDTLYPLRSIQDINVIVPIIGVDGVNVTSASQVLAVFGQVQSHLAFMNTQQQYLVSVFGEDGTSSVSAFQSLMGTGAGSVQNHAQQLQSNFGNNLSSQCVLLNNSVYQIQTPGGYTQTMNVGGQYAAAAVAGALASRPVSSALTHKGILGFTGIQDPRLPSDKNSDAAAGLFVVEAVSGFIRCRHALTLDIVNGVARAELSVVRAKFLMMESIQATIDNQIIGNIIADGNSPMIVSSAISGVLSALQQGKAIVSYTAPVSVITSLNPTIITSTFSYRPAFPVDFVEVSFNIDLTNQTVTAAVQNVTNSGV